APGALAMAKLLVPAGAMQEAAETPSAHRAVPEEVAEASALGGQRYRRRTATTTATGTAATGTDAAEVDSTDAAGAPASGAETDAATGRPAAGGTPADEDEPGEARNVIDAAARGAGDGLKLALNIGAMLLAFISLIALGNLLLGWISGWFGADLSIEQVFGYVFAPVMFLVGTPWPEALQACSFLGQKVVLNEFVAFSDFAPRAAEFSAKTQAVVTFALTGFANLGSIAILLGGLGGIAPSRRGDIAQLGVRAVLAGTLANLMSATIVGMLIG